MTISAACCCCGNIDGCGQSQGSNSHPVSRCAVFCFSKPPPGLVHLKHVICIVCKFLRRYNMCTQAQPMHCWCVRCNIGETIPRLSIKDTVLTTEPSNLFTARTFYWCEKNSGFGLKLQFAAHTDHHSPEPGVATTTATNIVGNIAANTASSIRPKLDFSCTAPSSYSWRTSTRIKK